jgi:hypothetical protein
MPKTGPRPAAKNQPKKNWFFNWLQNHKMDVIIAAILVLLGGLVSAVNMDAYPQRFEDEGTYISQAWAIQERGTLTHYTYWYDHPPVGWIQMAAHLYATDAIDRYGNAIAAGREFMLLLHLATIGLIYALARRLGIGPVAAGMGTAAYALSPLVVEFSRYILLDNVALPWLLGAFLLAFSPRQHILTAVGSAVCMAIAILSKETFAVLIPVLLLALWQSGDKRNRRYTLAAFGVLFITVSGMYVLYAALKSELLPGEGHVSLLGTLAWQIFGREGSGSLLEAGSGTRGLVNYWLNLDFWLIAAGVVSLPFAFFYRKLRVISLVLLIGILMMLRSGYLPYPYIIGLLPFAAITFAGVLHYMIIEPLRHNASIMRNLWASAAACALVVGAAVFVAPAWQTKLQALTTQDQDNSSRQAVEWIDKNVPKKDNRMVVESALWTDLLDKGYNDPDPVWLYKTETDPAVVNEIGGWRGIDYVILNGPTIGTSTFDEGFPTVHQAIKNGKKVAEFGSDNQKIIIYEVNN